MNKSEAKEDDTVYIYAHPESGNWLTYLKVTNSRGYELSVSYVRKNVYSFTMPASAVTIKAVFAPKWLTIAGILGIFEDNSSDFPFTDVALGTWYYQAVEFVYDYGYMDGVSATRFDPDGALSRGMLAKVLYNVEEEQRDFPTEFSDVPNSAWYADAVNWAAANDIVKGYGKDKFGPEDLVTREQMAAILYRYAELKGYDMSARADLSGHKDADKISSLGQGRHELGGRQLPDQRQGRQDPGSHRHGHPRGSGADRHVVLRKRAVNIAKKNASRPGRRFLRCFSPTSPAPGER